MSRVATWRRGPNDPDTARRWLFQSGTLSSTGEERSKPSPRKRRLIALGFVAYASALFGLFAFFPKHSGLAILLNLPYVIGNRIVTSRRKPFTKVGDGPGESVWVAMTIQDARGRGTGSDRGWLIHSEGWLLFEGERTSFAFTRGEARTSLYDSGGTFHLEDRRKVVFRPIGEKPDEEPLDQLIGAWKVAPIPDGEAILPPTDPHPQRWVDLYASWLLGAIVCATVGGFGIGFEVWPVTVFALISLVACLLVAASCSRRLRKELPRVLGSPLNRETDALESIATKG